MLWSDNASSDCFPASFTPRRPLRESASQRRLRCPSMQTRPGDWTGLGNEKGVALPNEKVTPMVPR